MRSAIIVLVALTGCNSGGNDPTSACTGYCTHFLNCDGVTGPAIDNSCAQSCADAGSFTNNSCPSTAVTNYYNCLEGLPCSDFDLDAGTDALLGAFTSCATQAGCL